MARALAACGRASPAKAAKGAFQIAEQGGEWHDAAQGGDPTLGAGGTACERGEVAMTAPHPWRVTWSLYRSATARAQEASSRGRHRLEPRLSKPSVRHFDTERAATNFVVKLKSQHGDSIVVSVRNIGEETR
jgi:hypothetical protein